MGKLDDECLVVGRAHRHRSGGAALVEGERFGTVDRGVEVEVVALRARFRVEQTLEGEHKIVGGDRLAVAPRSVLAQPDRVGEAVLGDAAVLPRRHLQRYRRYHVQLFVVGKEPSEELLHHADLLRERGELRVERAGVERDAQPELLVRRELVADLAAVTASAGDGDRGK